MWLTNDASRQHFLTQMHYACLVKQANVDSVSRLTCLRILHGALFNVALTLSESVEVCLGVHGDLVAFLLQQRLC